MRRASAWAIAALGFLVLVYIVYEHVASVASHRDLVGESWRESFTDEALFRKRFAVEVNPPLRTTFTDRGLHVESPVDVAALKGSTSFSTRLGSLDSGGLSIKFSGVISPGSAISISVRNQSNGRSVRLVLGNAGTGPHIALEGYLAPVGESIGLDRLLTDLEGVSKAFAVGSMHEVTLRFDADRRVFDALIDKIPVASCATKWNAGELVDGIATVTSIGQTPLSLDLREFAWVPDDGGLPPRGTTFADDFSGGVVDPLRWNASLTNDVGVTRRIVPGDGLQLIGAASSSAQTEELPTVRLCTRYFALTSLHVDLRTHISHLDFSKHFLSLENDILTRTVEFAITRGSEAAHVQTTGQKVGEILPTIDRGSEVSTAGELQINFDYDPWNARLRVALNSREVYSGKYGLMHGERSRLCFGATTSREGAFDISVRRIQVHAAPY